MPITVRDATYNILRHLNVTKIFGNPGSTEETFLENMPEDFSYIETLHESSAVGAADGYAQGTRTVGLVNVHTAAGLSNAMSNIYTALQNKTPLIITAGNQTREMLLNEPWLTNVNPEVLPKPFVKWSYQPVRAEDVPAAFVRAYAMAVQEPAGPVFLSIPLDDWDKTIESVPTVRKVFSRVAPDPDTIENVANMLNNSKAPVLVLGSDIARDSDGWKVATAFAEKLNVPVWAAPASERPPFPENHPLYLGGLPFAIRPLSEKLKDNDFILVIGASVFRYYPYIAGKYLPDGAKLVQITNDPYDAAKSPVGDSLISNATLAMKALMPLVKPHNKILNTQPQSHRMAPYKPSSDKKSHRGAMQSLELFQQLRSLMPDETVLIEESPSNLGDLHKAWIVDRPDSFYTFASGSLGWNLPASIGLALADQENRKNRLFMAVIGDGSLQYSVQGLWTAARYKLPILFVVPKNNDYGILKSFAVQQKTNNVPGLDIPNIDSILVAEGYGCVGRKAKTSSEVEKCINEFLVSRVPTVLEVDIDPKIPPLL